MTSRQTVEICEEDDQGEDEDDHGEDVEDLGEGVADVTMDPRFLKAHTSAAPPMEEDSFPSSYVFPSTVSASASMEPSQTGLDSGIVSCLQNQVVYLGYLLR